MHFCLVTSEILGAHKNGGIGTATSHLALFLVRHGHEVDILYTGAALIDYAHPWSIRCAAAGVSITHLECRQAEIYPEWLRETTVVYEYLRGTAYDLILFPDWEGLGFASVVARRCGLAFAQTRLGIIAHGPTAWLIDANRTPVREQTTLAKLHMERTALADADVLVCPSRHMLDWLRQHGHPVPDASVVLPLYLWSDPDADAAFRREAPLRAVRTLAFFGRLEERKGIELFMAALVSDRLAFEEFDVVFLGKAALLNPAEIIGFVQERRPWLVPRLRFETDLDSDQAQKFLVEQDCLAIVPSLIDNAPCVISECLRRGIPFLSTETGGIPELVAQDDRSRVLVAPQPKALAERIGAVLGQPFAPVRAEWAEPQVGSQWLAWLETCSTPVVRTAVPARPPPAKRAAGIAVIVTHYERPSLVCQTLTSLAAQTMTDFELVLVDDGSSTELARQKLDEIERQPWPFRLTLVRGQNRYLGAARNGGIAATTADRLIFMDDDNLAFPTLVDTLDRALTASGADILTCQMQIFRDPVGIPDLSLLDRGERWAFTAGPAELGLSVNCFGDATGIYRREVFDRIGLFHERRGVGHEDWHLHARAVLAGLITLSLPVPLYWYRRVASGMLSTTDQYLNNRIVWDAYVEALPPRLARFADLSIRNLLVP